MLITAVGGDIIKRGFEVSLAKQSAEQKVRVKRKYEIKYDAKRKKKDSARIRGIQSFPMRIL